MGKNQLVSIAVKKTLTFVAYLTATLACLLVGGLFALHFLLSSQTFEKELRALLSQPIPGINIDFDTLRVSLISGLEIQGVRVVLGGHSNLSVGQLRLSYRLSDLFLGQVTIEEISLTHLKGHVRLKDLPVSPPVKKSPPPPKTTKTTPFQMPLLPLAFELTRMALEDISLTVEIDENQQFTVKDAGFNLAVGLNNKGGKVTGDLHIATFSALLNDKPIQQPIDLDFALTLDPWKGQAKIKKLVFGSGTMVNVSLSGTFEHLFSQPKLSLTLIDTQFVLAELLNLAHPWLPSDLQNTSLSGVVTPHLNIQGVLTKTGFDGEASGEIIVHTLNAHLPTQKATLHEATIRVALNNAKVHQSQPESAQVGLKLDVVKGGFEQHVFQHLTLNVGGNYHQSGKVSGNIKLGVMARPSLPELPDISQNGVAILLNLQGDGDSVNKKGAVRQIQLDVGSFFKSQGTVAADLNGEQDLQTSGNFKVKLDAPNLLLRLPKAWLQAMDLKRKPGVDEIILNWQAILDKTFQLKQAKVSSNLHVGQWHVTEKEQDIAGTLDQLILSMGADFSETDRLLKGAVQTTLKLSDLKNGKQQSVKNAIITSNTILKSPLSKQMKPTQLSLQEHIDVDVLGVSASGVGKGGRANIQKSTLTLKATVDTPFSEEMKPTHLVIKETLDGQIEGLVFQDETMEAKLPPLTLFVKANNHLAKGLHHIHKIQFSGEKIFEIQLDGNFKEQSNHFLTQLKIPFIDLKKIHQHITLKGKDIPKNFASSGRISLLANASGTIPTDSPLDLDNLPFLAQLTLQTDNLSGTWDQMGVDDSDTKIILSLDPKKEQQLNIMVDMDINQIQLPNELPLSLLEQGKVVINLTGEDFNRLQIKQMDVGVKGANLSLEGEVSGFKATLSDKPPPLSKLVENLFTQLAAQISVDLDYLGQTKLLSKMQTKGKTTLTATLFKREQGKTDLNVSLLTDKVKASGEGFSAGPIGGTIRLRKSLAWTKEDALPNKKRTHKTALSAFLTELGGFSERGEEIRIHKLSFGDITAENISAKIGFEERALRIDNLSLTFLGGGIGGRAEVFGGRSFGINTALDVAGVDVNQLLPENKRIVGDSIVDLTMVGKGVFDPKRSFINWGETNVTLIVTHIGREVLDRVLAFLDPKESNPAIMNARSNVSLANPSKLEFQLANGMARIKIDFQSGLLSSIEIDRIPLTSLAEVAMSQEAKDSMAALVPLFEMVGGENYGFDKTGQLFIH